MDSYSTPSNKILQLQRCLSFSIVKFLSAINSKSKIIYICLPNSLSSCMLHFTMISCFTLAGFSEAPLGLTMLLATLNSLSLLELAAGTVKTILARSESNGNCCWWSFYHSSRCCCQHLAIALSYCIPSHIKLALRSSENVTPASPAASLLLLLPCFCWPGQELFTP